MSAYLVVVYDVEGLTEDEVDYLAGEATVQAEASDGWPGVGHPTIETRSAVIDAGPAESLRNLTGIYGRLSPLAELFPAS